MVETEPMQKTKKNLDPSEQKLDLSQMHMATDPKGSREMNSVDLMSMLIACEEEINTLLTEKIYTDVKTIKYKIEIIKEIVEVVGTNFPNDTSDNVNEDSAPCPNTEIGLEGKF